MKELRLAAARKALDTTEEGYSSPKQEEVSRRVADIGAQTSLPAQRKGSQKASYEHTTDRPKYPSPPEPPKRLLGMVSRRMESIPETYTPKKIEKLNEDEISHLMKLYSVEEGN